MKATAVIAVALFSSFSVFSAMAEDRAIDPANGRNLANVSVTDSGQSCSSCHGETGNPEVSADAQSVAPRLAGQWAVYLERQMRAYQQAARGQVNQTDGSDEAGAHNGLMALTDADLKDLSAWYASQEGQPIAPASEISDELLARGQVLYQQGSAEQGVVPCQVCHGAAGEGKQYLSYPVLKGQEQDYLARQLERFRDGSRAGWEESYLGNIMHAISKPLENKDIEALAGYIARMP